MRNHVSGNAAARFGSIPSAHPRCRVITTEPEFDSLKPLWDRCFQSNAEFSPFSSWIWVRTWWQHYRDHLAPRTMALQPHIVCTMDVEGRLTGIAPFYSAAPIHAPLRIASIRPMGSRLDGMQEDLTEEPVLLMRAGREQEALETLMYHLSAGSPRSAHDYFVLRLYESTTDSPLETRFQAALNGCILINRESHLGQRVILAETWEAFLRGLGKSMRDNVKYYPRLLTRRGYSWEIKTVTDPNAVRDAARNLVALHRLRASSLRGIAHTDHLPTDLQSDFLIDALYELAAVGMAELHCLSVDGSCVAVLSTLRHGRTTTIYYSGFDPAWYDYSPVTILTAEALRRAIARGDTTANFLPAEFAWKERWGTVTDRRMVQYTYLLRRPRALLRAAFESGRRTLMHFADSPR